MRRRTVRNIRLDLEAVDLGLEDTSLPYDSPERFRLKRARVNMKRKLFELQDQMEDEYHAEDEELEEHEGRSKKVRFEE